MKKDRMKRLSLIRAHLFSSVCLQVIVKLERNADLMREREML